MEPLTRDDLADAIKSFPTKDDLRNELTDHFDRAEQRAAAREDKNHKNIMGAFVQVIDAVATLRGTVDDIHEQLQSERRREMQRLEGSILELAQQTGHFEDVAKKLHQSVWQE